MKLETKVFGEIEIDEKKIINFDTGISPFVEYHKYAIIQEEDTDFYYLQCLEDGDLTFVVANLKNIKPDYNPKVDIEYLSELGEIKNNLEIYNIVVVKDTLENATVNLLAPIVVNVDNNKAKQVILANEEYGVRHQLYEEVKEA